MSDVQPSIRIMKVIVGIIALAWAAVMVAYYLGMSEQGDWMGDTAAFYAFLCGMGSLLGAIFTYLRQKWAVLLYLVSSLALILAPYMQGSIDLPFTMNWGYLALLGLYLIAVVPAWKHMGAAK